MKFLSAFREPVNALTHWAGVLAALLLLTPMLWWAGRAGLALWPFTIFLVSMALLYAASAAYHSFQVSAQGLLWLRKLDHAGIFLLIAGSYTPVVYYGLHGNWRDMVLYGIWGIAVAGIALKLLTMHLPRWVSTVLYLLMGWLAVVFLPQLVRNLPGQAILWLVVGGALYTAGAVIYATKAWNPRPGVFGFHEIWHLFVLGGSGAHVIMMFHLR